MKKKLDAIGLTGYPKTTGGDGMHIYHPDRAALYFRAGATFAEVIARLVAAERADLFTTPRSVEKREKNRVYFDYMQLARQDHFRAVRGAGIPGSAGCDSAGVG